MEHGFLDRYSSLDSPIHRLNERIKVLVAFIFTFTTALLPQGTWVSLIISTSFALIVFAFARLPFTLLFKRFLLVSPFIIIISLTYAVTASTAFLEAFLFIFIKALTCVIFMLLLISTTEFNALLKTFRSFGLPESITSILSFFYRYIFVIHDELERMQRALALRLAGNHSRRRLLKITYSLAGMLMLRSFERAERIFFAMKSRGFSGKITRASTLSLTKRDLTSFVVSALVLTTIIFHVWSI